MAQRILAVELVNDSSGDATEYTGYFSGYIDVIRLVSDNDESLAQLDITDDSTGEAALTLIGGVETQTLAIRQIVETSAMADVTGVYSPISVTDSRLKLVLDAAGADETTTTAYIYVSDEEPA